jgi:putative transposase
MATKPNDNSSLSHTRWNCKYHIVFIPKYRRKEIYGKLRSDIGLIIHLYNRTIRFCYSFFKNII